MTKTSYFDLDVGERESALRVAAEAAGRDAHLLEKDVWVVWTLDVLFRSRFGSHLVFKGGTSLSKVHRAIDRFSEDVDVTYDIRELVPPAREAEGALPQSGSQAKRWSEAVAEELPKWVRDEIAPLIETALVEQDLSATVEVEGSDLKIRYEPSIVEGYGYIKPRVLLEFGGRSTGEPCDKHDVTCDAAVHLPDVVFPTARPRTMRAERTFWEKATAIHGYATGGRLPGLAIARHWLDVYNMAEAGIAERATGDRDLASQVADHKKLFFRVTTPTGPVDYHRAVTGELRLVPEDDAKLANLADDYVKMLDARLPHGETAPSFDNLMRGCAQIAERINAATRST